ncbi:HGxxPAAW family protein [Streptomonospora wellingtoniae]|uniref:HGxxPAAW family protein n=1 Tax=Streptomonospora wellingtoniae TaxID=3075544 RepID=A0ABU2KVR3_9ACTN|nr:HGxxPAAW family protein [Streptomonospora sp. DSM 45055]MDT0303391.1 HGxxPAAW family protein [Streptomonospora sp. DSM 45055]
MADEHHEDHGHTLAGWFLTMSWIVVWTAAGLMIILVDQDVVLWSVAALGLSVACAAVAGIMKKAGLGRKHPRPTPPTRQEWEAQRSGADAGTAAAEAEEPDEESDESERASGEKAAAR